MFDLDRFVSAQEYDYPVALSEIKAGRKYSHWIWYIYPQLKGLGRSYNSDFYGLASVAEAKAYLDHPVLGARLREIVQALLQRRGKNPKEILGDIDASKVRSSMTLFDIVSPNDIFGILLDEFYNGRRCHRTMGRLSS